MNLFVEQILLAFGGFLFHLLKQYKESLTRKEVFVNKMLLVTIGMNTVAVFLLIYVGNTLPEDLIVMSPLTCIIIGYFGSSLLAGFIENKKPKSLEVGITDTVKIEDKKVISVEPDPAKLPKTDSGKN